MLSVRVRPEPVEPKASEHPFVLSLSKDTYRREAWFDRLTTNGPYAQPLPFKAGDQGVGWPRNGSKPVGGFDAGLASEKRESPTNAGGTKISCSSQLNQAARLTDSRRAASCPSFGQ